MKNKIIISIYVFLLATILFSCKKQEAGPILEIISGSELTEPASGETYDLADYNAEDIFATFRWTEAEYNVAVEVSYTLEVDLKANNFSNPVVLGMTIADSLEMTVFDFNVALTTSLGMEVGVADDISIRVGSHGASSEKAYSTAIDMNVTAYNPPYTPDSLFIMSNGVKLKAIALLDEEGNYEAYVYLTDTDTEIIIKGNDDDAREFGDTGADNILDEDGDAIVIPVEGHYRFKINMFDLSLELSENDWGIIGSAVDPYDWSEDIDMAYIGNDTWEISTDTIANPIVDGQFKFRPNDLWDPLNYGDDGADGIPEEYGANIDILGGNYKITLNLNEFPYSITIEALAK